MAINFLNDLDFNQNEAFHLVLENQANDTAAGTPVDGQLYYDTGNNVVKYGEGGSWVELATSSGAGTVTSITLGADSGSGTAITSSGTFTFSGGTNVTTSVSGTTVTINSTDQYVGTVTSVTLAAATGDKAGISLSGTNPITSSGTITVGVDIDGQTELATTAAGGDYVLLWDADADTNKKISVTNLVAAAPQGDITGITAGDGIAVTSGTGPVPTIAVDYTATGLIADATDGTGVTLVDADDFIFQDDGGGGVKYANLSQLKTYIDADNYNYWTIAGGTSGSSNVSTTQTVTIAGTTNQLTADESGRTVTLAFPTGGFTAPDGSIATTQSNSDNSTKLATTAYVDSMVSTIVSGLSFQGSWNANTNTPTLASGTGTPGYFYIVSVAGTTSLDGISDWAVGDWAVFTEQGGTDAWEKIDNSSTLSGGGTAAQVAYWSASTTLTGDADMTFDGDTLTVSSSTIGANISSAGTLTVTTIAEVGSDTDKFLMSDSGVVKFVTGANLRSYIGAGTGDGTVTSVGLTDGYLIDSSGTNPITGSGTWTIGVDASELTDMTEAITTADEVFVLDTSETGADQGKRKTWSEIISDLGLLRSGVTSIAAATGDKAGLHFSASTGAVTAGVDIDGQTALSATPASTDAILIYDADADANKKITVDNLSAYAGGTYTGLLTSATSGITRAEAGGYTTFDCEVQTLINSGVNGTNCMVEVLQESDKATVYADITRDADEVFIKFKGSVANAVLDTSGYRVLIRDNGS